MKTVVLAIQGMHCDGCAETVNAILKLEKGVASSTVFLDEQQARIEYDPASTGPDRLIFAIERAGYSAAQMGS